MKHFRTVKEADKYLKNDPCLQAIKAAMRLAVIIALGTGERSIWRQYKKVGRLISKIK